MALWPLGSYEREVGPATQIRNLDWLHRLCNNDFVAVSNKTDRGKELVNQIPSQGWVHCRLAHEAGPLGEGKGARRSAARIVREGLEKKG